MKKRNIIIVLFLIVASLQTARAQGFRVYKSDGTIVQYSLHKDSIAIYSGGSDEDLGPFTPVNQCIVGTWYKSKSETVTFNEDGTTDYMEGATFEFLPYQGSIIIYRQGSDTPVNFLKVYKVTAEEMIVSTPGNNNFYIMTRTQPIALVREIVLSETSLTLQPDELKTLTAIVLPEDADNPAVTWESSNNEVAEVNMNGRVIANTDGTCIITCRATDGSGVYAECQVTVGEPAAEGEKSFTVNGVAFKMKKVVGGTFTMGATSEQSNGYTPWDDEKPTHLVTLSDYWMGETEVTQALWYAVMDAKPTNDNSWSTDYGLGNNYPAYYVSWNDCQTFITKLNQLTGASFRMPTEAEWEFAARGGTQSQGYIFSGSNSIDDVAWYFGNSGSKPHEVGTKAPNELGIYDMSGNVWEWCGDWFGSYSSDSQTNPIGPTSGSYRVRRGGSWGNDATSCRVADRNSITPTSTYYTLGLRLAL